MAGRSSCSHAWPPRLRLGTSTCLGVGGGLTLALTLPLALTLARPRQGTSTSPPSERSAQISGAEVESSRTV